MTTVATRLLGCLAILAGLLGRLTILTCRRLTLATANRHLRWRTYATWPTYPKWTLVVCCHVLSTLAD